MKSNSKSEDEISDELAEQMAREYAAALNGENAEAAVDKLNDINCVETEYDDILKMPTLAGFPDYVPEEENPDILVRGRWLERGGSGWIVSTAGTGKSIMSIQLALSWAAGVDFFGLKPHRKMKIWVIQTEDSPSRVTIDREDVIAELSETMPNTDWREVAKRVYFPRIPGKVGVRFLEELDSMLSRALSCGVAPDVIILNPFMSVIGGPVSDSTYVTPFLRGGTIGREETCGLQDILERHHAAALIFHHTPKPPTAKELDGWLKSAFPEYQGAGSSDITNWGRSFITMMKIPNVNGTVCLTAGKNGANLDWDFIAGAKRKYLCWSNGDSVDGGRRHAWREATKEDLGGVVKIEENNDQEDRAKLVKALVEKPMIQSVASRAGILPYYRFKKAWAFVTDHAAEIGLYAAPFSAGKTHGAYLGKKEDAIRAAKEHETNWQNASKNGTDGQTDTNGHERTYPSVKQQTDKRTSHPPKGGDADVRLLGAIVSASEAHQTDIPNDQPSIKPIAFEEPPQTDDFPDFGDLPF